MRTAEGITEDRSLPELINSIIIKAAEEFWQDKLEGENRDEWEMGHLTWQGAVKHKTHAGHNKESNTRGRIYFNPTPTEEIIIPFMT